MDREVLALLFGVAKFHQYLYDHTKKDKLVLITDHKPQTYLFRHDVDIPTMASLRVQRWALTLFACKYRIEFREGSDN